jgi:hypothetical protein
MQSNIPTTECPLPAPTPAELSRVLSVLLPDGRRQCRLCDAVPTPNSNGGHSNFANHLRTLIRGLFDGHVPGDDDPASPPPPEATHVFFFDGGSRDNPGRGGSGACVVCVDARSGVQTLV